MDVEEYLNQGEMAFMQGNIEKAVGYINSAVKGDHKNSIIYYHAGVLYAKKGESEKAKEYLSKAMEMGLKEDYMKDAEGMLKSLN